MVQNGGRPRRLSNGITVQNGLQKGQSQSGSSRNSLVVNNGHLHPGYLPKRSSSPRLTVSVNGKSSERRYIILVIMITYSAGNLVVPQIRTDTDLGTLIGNIQCGNFWVFMPLKNLREIDFNHFEALKKCHFVQLSCILGHPSSMAGLPKDIKPPQSLLSILDALSTYTDKQRE